MYTALLHSHNGLRWLVLLAFIFAIAMTFIGWMKRNGWSKTDSISGLILVILMDIQFLIGIILYAFVSPITKAAFSNFGAAMKNSDLRFYAVEHILMMVIALVLVHLGKIKSKRTLVNWKKHRVAAIYYSIALLVVLAAIPWNRAMF